jgi:hypothetical protein
VKGASLVLACAAASWSFFLTTIMNLSLSFFEREN